MTQLHKDMTRRRFAVADLSKEEFEKIAASRMSPEHDHLNALLDEYVNRGPIT